MRWQLGVCFGVFLLFAGGLVAQQTGLPHILTPAEEEAFPAYQEIETEAALSTPIVPPTRVRTMAEWEEVQALVLSWTDYTEVLTEIVRYAVDECEVFILTPDALQTEVALSVAGIPLERVHLLPIGFNSIWMRDYGPWAVYHQYVDSLAISDYLYNRPDRTADDLVPHELADYLNLPLYNADDTPYRWIHAGGNFLRDGLGTAWSSDLVLKDNSGKTGLELAEYARLFFGITDYRVLPRLPYDQIHHLDMHMRVLDEETIAVNQYPRGIADGPQIEANLRWLRQHYRTPYGKPYRILRLPVPPQAGQYPPASDYLTYANAIFINKSLLVPVYDHPLDSVALQIYRDYLPGHRVVGIDCNSIIEAVGALHCVAKVVGTRAPLYLAHARIRDTYETAEPYLVQAQVYHRSGLEAVYLHYRTDTTAHYRAVPMVATGLDSWQAAIPAQPAGTDVQYYLEARARSGKVQYRPLPAPQAYYQFAVKPYTALPTVDWLQSLYYLAPGTKLRTTADIAAGATSYAWTFPGGQPAAATTAAVEVSYPEAGRYPIELRATNPVGVGEERQDNAVSVLPLRSLFRDSFSVGSAPEYWWADNTNAPSAGWQWADSEYCYGGHWRISHQEAAAPLERAYLRTAIDLRDLESATLSFAVAYASHPASYARMDELRIYLTTEAGEIVNVYNKGGQVLATQQAREIPYEPDNCLAWRQETVDLRSWLGQRLVLTFESIGGQGNTLYLDDIQLSTNVPPAVWILEPTPDTILRAVAEQPLSIPIALSAYDSDGGIAEVDLYVNEQRISAFSNPPYRLSYQLPGFGRYCVQAKARDVAGATAWSNTHCLVYEREVVATQTPRYQAWGQLIPNPVGEWLQFRWQAEQHLSEVAVSLLDARGRTVRQTNWTLAPGEDVRLGLGGLSAGVYYLRLEQQRELIWFGRILKAD